MKIILMFWIGLFCSTLCYGQGSLQSFETHTENAIIKKTNSPIHILSLGDSYTVGESVCSTCNFPNQLKDSLQNKLPNIVFNSTIVAETGWTTSDLINAIPKSDLNNKYDFVTLLIGVNNQFQNLPFSNFEREFSQLINTAFSLASQDSNKVILISIPDYAFTPFGQNSKNPSNISEDIDTYNSYIANYCKEQSITFVPITDITREGLDNPDLVAADNLHPSELAYAKFVERLLPIVLAKLE